MRRLEGISLSVLTIYKKLNIDKSVPKTILVFYEPEIKIEVRTYQ
ncbi:hypothetical protein L21SP2_2453 [Salinispira pacifica]|uniref:Uncharacterized protein n=1 Tax=Salinispira pacifica TaxID=1307761 RepID=V5WKT6_9SPIO|nr:hypothetical protein L21SP2_2453 [Salinispira pacifica]